MLRTVVNTIVLATFALMMTWGAAELVGVGPTQEAPRMAPPSAMKMARTMYRTQQKKTAHPKVDPKTTTGTGAISSSAPFDLVPAQDTTGTLSVHDGALTVEGESHQHDRVELPHDLTFELGPRVAENEPSPNTQPTLENWQTFTEIEVDETTLQGPIVMRNTKTDRVTQLWLGFTERSDAAATWAGPRDCSNGDDDSPKYTCTGSFFGWTLFDEGGPMQTVYQVWLIERTRTPDWL